MINYFSTFISGFQNLIESQLPRTLPDAKIQHLFNGLVIYQTNASPENIKNIKFFKTIFQLTTIKSPVIFELNS